VLVRQCERMLVLSVCPRLVSTPILALVFSFSHRSLFPVRRALMEQGGFDFDVYLYSRYPALSISLLVIYIFVVTILMFNLLIAMMSDSM
jgi:uncharacterized protein YggT (Ycf19 family)